MSALPKCPLKWVRSIRAVTGPSIVLMVAGGDFDGGARAPRGAAKERVVTPSKITAWLDCPHYLTLTTRVDDGLLAKPSSAFGSFAQLLADKGLTHEQDCLTEYRAQGKSVFEVPAKLDGEPFTAWVAQSQKLPRNGS